jgi:hypothetical protein
VSISSLTQVTTLSGIGVIPLQVSPTSLDFGSNILVGTSTPAQLVSLQNQLQTAQQYTIASSAGFPVKNPCADPLPASSTCSMSVQFQAASAGTQHGTLTVSYPNTSITSVLALSGAATAVPFVLQPGPGQALSATVQAGNSATFQLQIVAATGFTGTVQLSCAGAPQNAVCSVPSSVTLASGATANFALNISTSSTSGLKQSQNLYPIFAAIFLLPLLRLNNRSLWTWVLLVSLACIPAITGCAGNGSGGGSFQNNPTPHTYSLSLTGTSGTYGQPVTLTLTIE